MKTYKLQHLPFRKSILISVLLSVVWAGCNMSDDSENLPGCHTYYSEGRCYKKILINIKDVEDIESCVSECKYNDDFITVAQTDSIKCEAVGLKSARNKRYYIINVRKE